MMKYFSMGSFVGGFMLGALFVGSWLYGNDSSLTSFLQPSAGYHAGASKAAAEESRAISVNDQPAGLSVTLESVTVPPPGVWVAVREVNGADLGNVLGAVRVNGPRSSISVPLLRATEPGLSYAVELYRADSEVFDLATNSVYIDFASGAPVIAHFTTTNP
ncbi:MAG: hypothetical protein ACHQU0_03125 [Candidatus Paceibacteria bacterium]